MDEYIYNPPPPPPPPSSVVNVSQPVETKKFNRRNQNQYSNPLQNQHQNQNQSQQYQGQSHNRNQHSNQHPNRAHPYKRPNESSADGNVAAISPEIKEAAKDIQQWIEQRRKNWPSNKRILEKEKVKEAKDEKEKERKIKEEQDKQTAINSSTSSTTPTTSTSTSTTSTNSKSPCRYFLKGRCKAGTNCKYSHEKSNPTTSTVKYKRFEAPNHSSLFKKLVQTDLDNENNQIINFITFLEEKGLL